MQPPENHIEFREARSLGEDSLELASQSGALPRSRIGAIGFQLLIERNFSKTLRSAVGLLFGGK